RIDFAIGRFHGEVMDCALRHAVLGFHLRGHSVRQADDEVAIGIWRRNVAVRQFSGADKSRSIWVACRRRRAGRPFFGLRRWLRGLGRSQAWRDDQCKRNGDADELNVHGLPTRSADVNMNDRWREYIMMSSEHNNPDDIEPR